jgi:hypothetical protein
LTACGHTSEKPLAGDPVPMPQPIDGPINGVITAIRLIFDFVRFLNEFSYIKAQQEAPSLSGLFKFPRWVILLDAIVGDWLN